ncbi:MAG: C40 family peptidase [Clostridia bacterium]|nr:C40 family peptidase [Clostridia bacterium]
MRALKRIILLTAAAVMLFTSAGIADRYHVLDVALSMLEEGNPFLKRYNEDTGAEIESRFPLGCPYYWGGRHVDKILEKVYPEQGSDYYQTDRQYLYGLDCAGYTRWITEQMGYTPHDSISNLLNRSKYKDYVIYKAAKKTGTQRVEELSIGDILCIEHPDGGYHCAMFIGTLLDFGYTARALPKELRPYLHHPLLIHCTGSSDYYERYRAYLEEQGDTTTQPPYGGVVVTLLDAATEDAPSRTPAVLDLETPCFDLEGYHLQVTDLSGEKQTRWIRWREKPAK